MNDVMLVTGGGRGIGAAAVRLAAARGYRVVVNYLRDGAAASELVRAIEAAGGTALALQADVSRESEVVRLFETIDQALGPLSVLVNNAGIVDQAARVDTMSEARLLRMFASNVFSTFLCSRQAVLRMSTRHGGLGGAIINVSSAASRLGSPGTFVDYAASKAAIDTFTLGLAKEVAEEGIRVNALRPGLIATDIHASGGDPDRAERLRDQIPMRRVGTADEVAHSILWLASAEASYCTGAILDVSGGR